MHTSATKQLDTEQPGMFDGSDLMKGTFEEDAQRSQSDAFACSVQYNEVYVWGDNSNGQLGLGDLAIDSK